jgi:hypothetical protein
MVFFQRTEVCGVFSRKLAEGILSHLSWLDLDYGMVPFFCNIQYILFSGCCQQHMPCLVWGPAYSQWVLGFSFVNDWWL